MISYGFVENSDYKVLLAEKGEQTGRGGSNRKDHMLSLNMAENIAMVQRNKLGMLVRQYLLWAHEKLREITSVISQQQIELPKTPGQMLITIGKALEESEARTNKRFKDITSQMTDMISTDQRLQEQIDQNSEAIRQVQQQIENRGSNRNISVLTEERNYNPITAEGNTTTREFSEILQSLGYDMGIVKLNNYLVDNGMFQRLKRRR